MILLVGPPGSGKTTFCQQVIVQNLGIDAPVIYMTTEYGSDDAERNLKERGLREVGPELLRFVDAYHQTVGLSSSNRPDTVHAHCEDLSSMGIAITKQKERMGSDGAILVLDSLTSPYLFNGSEVLRFIRSTLSGFAAEGNGVLASIDEGCGRPEDLIAMMSLSKGVMKLGIEQGKRVLDIVKHPAVEQTRVEVPGPAVPGELWDMQLWEEEIMKFPMSAMRGEALAEIRGELGNYVNAFWPNFVHWSSILWDPKKFPEMAYEMSLKHGEGMKEVMELAPWYQRLLFSVSIPKSLSRVKDMKKMQKIYQKMTEGMGAGILEYLEDRSRTDEHYFRIDESFECWGLENVGAPMAYVLPPATAGMFKGLESWKGLDRDWNAIETKCVGLGDPYCEWKVVRGEIPELKDSLTKDSAVIERMHDRLMARLLGYLVDGKPLVERPESGSDVVISIMMHCMLQPALAGERYRVVMRMAGAKAGKEVGEHVLDAGVGEDESVDRVLDLLEYCKVGKVSVEQTLRMRESCESVFYRFMTESPKEPRCFFTTGFLNGFFFVVKGQHVRETRCIAMGDPYCEWEFR